jgi:hypothetical protein
MRAKAFTASRLGTATRTISQPWRLICRICLSVAETSAVETFVMD